MKVLTKLLSICVMTVFLSVIVAPSTVMASSLCKEKLSEKQKVFLLSLLSNAVSDLSGYQKELEKEAKRRIEKVLGDSEIQGCVGEWKIVWGPAVFKVVDTSILGADHVMFVAKSGNQHVVAIAGSNKPLKSPYNWLINNLNVFKQNRWHYGNQVPRYLKPKISKGTDIGIRSLLKMVSPFESRDQILQDFLQEEKITDVIFTGHSLGGALSPTLALAILDQSPDRDKLKISVYPSAGPTPGEGDFVEYYNSRLGNTTMRIWNQFDVVPHAWEPKMLDQIPSLFEPDLKLSFWPKAALIGVITGIKAFLPSDSYVHILRRTQPEKNAQVKHPVPAVCPNFSLQATTTWADNDKISEITKLLENQITTDPELARKLEEMLNSSSEFQTQFGIEQGQSIQLMAMSQPERIALLRQIVIDFEDYRNQALYQHVEKYFDLLDVKNLVCYAQKLMDTQIRPDLSPSEIVDLTVQMIKGIDKLARRSE